MHRHNVHSPFRALFNVFNDSKSFIYHFHLAGIVQSLQVFSLLYTIDANDYLNQHFVYFMGALLFTSFRFFLWGYSFFLMLCEANITEIFISI